ncbi:hypothetical protein VTN49DRAFT_2130 [Thermomyces lanuginosus]|uniref:uncharacterized protein n=1 Tax=Thermomyces lanuginosus TaxID=5541 RepID=UPI003742F78F
MERGLLFGYEGWGGSRFNPQKVPGGEKVRCSTAATEKDGWKITKEEVMQRWEKGETIHRRELPEPPERHEDLASHPLGELFLKGEIDHLKSHVDVGTWEKVRVQEKKGSEDPMIRSMKILGCRWVYAYKFDKHGRLQKVKARLVIRGDQQARVTDKDTYAATLAGRSFRILMAIAARFNLELVQYDAVNAFVNAHLDEVVFMRMPPGYEEDNMILRLRRALYGRRRSPLLWQKELTKTLLEIGFERVPHEPCAFIRNGVILFFYVDDIVVAYRKEQRTVALRAIIELKKRYKLQGGDNLNWFLGIRVLRDRTRRRIWLSQASYIDKISGLADTREPVRIPMGREELLPYDGCAELKDIRRYQQKVGSLMYVAVHTRPDIAFAVSRLARFMTNPGPEHHEAADRVLNYLAHTKSLGLEFGGDNHLRVASDASFADNTLDRKSSQAFAMKLFGGMIGWRANKQDTVTTSTTEAELLALAQAAKESMFVSRLLAELKERLDEERIQIECDNKQTIGLVTKDTLALKSSLRHVDIHNHWLRQEYQRGGIVVKYTESSEMMADGLTKALPRQSFERFRNQMGLVDIRERLQEEGDPGTGTGVIEEDQWHSDED